VLTGPLSLAELDAHPGVTGLAIGVFDGVHLGHQAVVRSLTGNVAVLTFEPHPLAVIAPERLPARLTSLDQRVHYLRELGTVAVVAVKFDPTLRELSPAGFVGEVARIFPDLREIAIGENWSFGRHREGNAARLGELAAEHKLGAGRGLRAGGGLRVKAIAPVQLDGALVSSTRIREAIAQRRFDEAARCLGRSHAVTGTVIAGEARGRTIGFPTANLADVEQLLPPRGVYAVRARVADVVYPAVMNLGQRPTFTSNGMDSLEVHLLEGGRDLYGAKLELFDFAWIRDERRFSDAEALKSQIAQDVEAAGRLLKN
jgi:riboflavin kinase/FMN adenylyltransferase